MDFCYSKTHFTKKKYFLKIDITFFNVSFSLVKFHLEKKTGTKMIIFYHIFEKVLVSVEYFDVLVRTTFFKSNFNFKKIRQKKRFCIKFDGFYVITKKIKIVISRKAAN